MYCYFLHHSRLFLNVVDSLNIKNVHGFFWFLKVFAAFAVHVLFVTDGVLGLVFCMCT